MDKKDPQSSYKKAGVMSDAQRKMRNGNIEAIKKNWNVENFLDFFPDSIRPHDLGNSALVNLRSISKRITKAAARSLFLNECRMSGHENKYYMAGFSHTARILKTLTANDNSPKPAKSNTKPVDKRASKKAHDSDALDSSPRPRPKKLLGDKFPTGPIPKRSSTGPGFTPINNASPNDDDSFIDLISDDEDNDNTILQSQHNPKKGMHGSPTQKGQSDDSSHLRHAGAPRPSSNASDVLSQSPYSESGHVGSLQKRPNGRLDLNKGAPSTVLKPSKKENQMIMGQNKPRDLPVGLGCQFPRRNSETSLKNASGNLMSNANPVQPNDDKTKDTRSDDSDMDHEKAMAEIERKMEQRREMREREAQKLREQADDSATTRIPSAAVPFTYTAPFFPDAVARNVKAKSAEPTVPTKRPFEEEMRDIIIVATSSLPPAKRRKAGSAPLEATEFSSSPPVAPIAPMMGQGPVHSPLANKRPKVSSVSPEDSFPNTPGWAFGFTPTAKAEARTIAPLKTGNLLSPKQKAPIAPMHTPGTPITSTSQEAPSPTSARKEGKTKKTGANINDSSSRTSRKARWALRAINTELVDVAKIGDARGEEVMNDFMALLQKTSEELKKNVDGLVEKHGLGGIRAAKDSV